MRVFGQYIGLALKPFFCLLYVHVEMGMYVEQVITKLLYLINQGETFTKVRIRSTFLVLGFLALGFLVYAELSE